MYNDICHCKRPLKDKNYSICMRCGGQLDSYWADLQKKITRLHRENRIITFIKRFI